jgi:DNA-binding response OmpR family regulator
VTNSILLLTVRGNDIRVPKIALLEQSPSICRLFEACLLPSHCAVSVFEENEAILHALLAFYPDLVILGNISALKDRHWDFFLCLKEHPATQNVPILIATTASLPLLQGLSLEQYEKVWVLVKPFTREQLLNGVAIALAAGNMWETGADAQAS